jgi:hypothetical protein
MVDDHAYPERLVAAEAEAAERNAAAEIAKANDIFLSMVMAFIG